MWSAAGVLTSSDEAGLIGLLHRADWTRLSLSAQVSDGCTLLILPGRRYRLQTEDYVTGCDGVRPWELSPDDPHDPDGSVHWVSGPQPPLRKLVCPAWLLQGFRLETRDRVSICGRDALQVVAVRREGIRSRNGPAGCGAGRVEAVVDAELGILLRVECMPDGEAAEVTEVVSLELSPVADPAQFLPPPGSLLGESLGESLRAAGPAWRAAKTAAGLAAGSLGAWIKYSPSSRGQPAQGQADGAEAEVPHDDPAPDLSSAGLPAGPQVSDQILRLLHDSGTSEFAATLHQWCDVGAMLARVPAAARRTGFGGLGLLVDAGSERSPVSHLVCAVRIGGAGRYQVDHAFEPRRGPKTVACDGQRRWKVYSDKATVGPAAPPPGDIAHLADASWLLACRLSGGAHVVADGRRAYRISVVRGDEQWSPSTKFSPAVAVVDAELGIVLRLTSYMGGKPVRRYELRDITTGPSAFRIDIPPNLPVSEETGPSRDASQAGPSHTVNLPLRIAGQVTAEAAKAARNFLRRINTR
jgi:hypothetical protein